MKDLAQKNTNEFALTEAYKINQFGGTDGVTREKSMSQRLTANIH